MADADYAWPRAAGRLFDVNGLFVSIIMSIALALAVGLMLAMINPALFWGVHLGEGAFYVIMPHDSYGWYTACDGAISLLPLSLDGAVIGQRQGHVGEACLR